MMMGGLLPTALKRLNQYAHNQSCLVGRHGTPKPKICCLVGWYGTPEPKIRCLVGRHGTPEPKSVAWLVDLEAILKKLSKCRNRTSLTWQVWQSDRHVFYLF